MTTNVTWGVIYTPSETAADIADVASSINTVGKYEGLMVWDTTNKRQLRASGSLPADDWDVIDGSVQITPS
jgi:hypothetical protein